MPTAAVKVAAASTPSPPKRLLFDRRYGWIVDEWKEPSIEALSGGRGMFCVVPLAKALIQKTSETINFVGSSTMEILERPEMLSSKAVQETLTGQMHKLVSSVKSCKSVLMVGTIPGRSNKTEFISGLADGNTVSHTE